MINERFTIVQKLIMNLNRYLKNIFHKSFYNRHSDKISALKLQMKKEVIKRKKLSTNQTTNVFSMNKTNDSD